MLIEPHQVRAWRRSWKAVAIVDQKRKALANVTDQFGLHDVRAQQVLSELWDSAFEQGRLAALDELQDRLCVCTK
jgi:hypothetical protein